MKTFLYCSLMLGLAALALSQEQSAVDMLKLPDGPLLKRTPERSQWMVTSEFDNEKQDAGTTTSKKGTLPRRTVISKNGSLFCEQIMGKDNKTTIVWHDSGLRISQEENGTTTVGPDWGGQDAHTTNFSVSDFGGLDWISANSFAGIKKYEGRDCIFFKGELSMLSVEESRDEDEQAGQASRKAASDDSRVKRPFQRTAKAQAWACVDLESRLPVAAGFGSEIRKFTYFGPPSTDLELPLQLVGARKAYLDRLKRLSAPPPPP